MNNIIIDAIYKNNNIARIEVYGVIIEIPLTDLPNNCKEGDALQFIKSESNLNKLKTAQLEQELFK